MMVMCYEMTLILCIGDRVEYTEGFLCQTPVGSSKESIRFG